MAGNGKIMVEILRTTANIGKQGEIKEVSLTFAQNKLFPEKIARPYVPQWTKEDKRISLQERRFEIVKRLHEKTLKVSVSSGSEHLSETIDVSWIIAKIREKFHITLLPEMIHMDVKHIKKIGEYTIHIDIFADAYAQLTLVIY